MVRETTDPTFFNEVSNHPKVRPWVAPPSFDGQIDVAPLFEAGAIGLCTDHGGFMLTPSDLPWDGPDVYEGHAFFLPQEDRYERAVKDTREAVEYAFEKLGVTRIEQGVPLTSLGVRNLLNAVGFVMTGKPFDKNGVEVQTYSLWPAQFAAILRT